MTLEPINVLLVEDNPGDARMVRDALAESDSAAFEVTRVQRLSEALERLRQKSIYDVVLLDLGLPDSHGLETLAVARAQAPRVPIVVLTGFQDEALGLDAVKWGAQDYLLKGHLGSELLALSTRYAIQRKRAEEALAQHTSALAKAEELQHSRQRIIAAQEGVRRDIAAHLHGRVQGKLLALKGHVERYLSSEPHSGKTSQLLCKVVEGIDRVVEQDINVLSRRLYPSVVRLGLVPALESLGDHFGESLPLEADLDEKLSVRLQAEPDLVLEPVRLAAYRIAENALTNVVKHAKGGRVSLRLDLDSAQQLRLTVRDDGRGFNLDGATTGLGLAAMQDYAEAVGGTCVIHSAPGRGTEVIATFSLVESIEEPAGTDSS